MLYSHVFLGLFALCTCGESHERVIKCVLKLDREQTPRLIEWYGTRPIIIAGAMLYTFWLSMVSVLPTFLWSKGLDGLTIYYYWIPSQAGQLIFMFLAGIFYGVFYSALLQAAVVTEKLASRPWLGFYYG